MLPITPVRNNNQTVSYDTKSISTSILKARYEINLIRAGLENPQIILYRNIAHDLLSK